MVTVKNKWHLAILLLLSILSISIKASAQPLTTKQIDSLTLKAMKVFNVPGMSIAIVKDGKAAYLKGYGVSSIATRQPVDENTLFGIASNSKAFTTAALGVLVNEGKLKWDDKVIDYIPEFQIFDPYETANFTITDLLTHRSGLAQNEGDLMHNPDSADFTINDVVHNLRYFKPASSFRSTFAYDNILYLVAAELVKRLSGISWQQFIETRVMRPLQMKNSGASYVRVKHNKNIIDGHYEVDGKLYVFRRSDEESDAGAGGIYSSAADMSKWMLMQLNNGRYGPGLTDSLFSTTIHKEMWTPQIIIPVRHPGIYNTHFSAYGLGWFLSDPKGYFEVAHSGQDDGMISFIELVPELNLGITILSNQEGGGAVVAAIDQITDGYFGIKGVDHIKEYADRVSNNGVDADTVTSNVWKQISLNEKAALKPDINNYTGTYADKWFGKVEIYENNGKLWFRSIRSKQLRGPLSFYKGNTFVVKWVNPQIKADGFVSFILDETGKANSFTMKAVSDKTSPGYDFKDLDFSRVN